WSICKIAKKGLIPSQIGAILPDSHGIAQVKSVTGSKILSFLKARGNGVDVGFAPDTPEGLYHLIKKAVVIRKHLRGTGRTESRIHRLARYHKKTKKLSATWK
ncbi:hypothetical protein GW17_00014453, partial [Ensete ventricosum]